MKLFCTFTAGILFFLGACRVSGEEQGKDKFAHITQDDVGLDLDTGDLGFNDEPVSPERLEEQLQKSYSVSLAAVSFSGELPAVSSSHLMAVLEMMDRAKIDPKRVRLNLHLPPQQKRNQYHRIELGRDGALTHNGSEIAVAHLAEKHLRAPRFTIGPMSNSENVDYRQFLSVLRAMGRDSELAGLSFDDHKRVEVEVLIYHPKDDGKMDVISAPKVTVKPGDSATIRVVTNGSGRQTYPPGTDEFHQEDLANLGIRLSAKPQIIGDHIRVFGVAILTKLMDRTAVFVQEDIPVASYSCSKTVVPFSFIFPPGTDTVDFPAAKVDGKETMCRLTAVVVDGRGMTRKERDQARLSPLNQPVQ